MRVEFKPDLNQQELLKTMFEVERTYWNTVVGTFGPLSASQPHILEQITNSVRDLIVWTSQMMKSWDQVINWTREDIHPPHSFLWDPKDDRNILSSKTLHLVINNLSAVNGLHPFVKSAILKQAFQTYLINNHTLQPAERTQKRHIQLPRRVLKVHYHAQHHATTIKLPYNITLICPEIDILRDNTNWDWCLIHRDPQRHPPPNAPWYINIYNNGGQYMYQYFENYYAGRW